MREPITHYKKCLTNWFQDVVDGLKTAELRLNDCDYQVGDTIVLTEIATLGKLPIPTGSVCEIEITHILTAEQFPDGLKENYAMLSFRKGEIEEMKGATG